MNECKSGAGKYKRERKGEKVNIERGEVVQGIKKIFYYFRNYNDFFLLFFSAFSLEVQLFIHLLR